MRNRTTHPEGVCLPKETQSAVLDLQNSVIPSQSRGPGSGRPYCVTFGLRNRQPNANGSRVLERTPRREMKIVDASTLSHWKFATSRPSDIRQWRHIADFRVGHKTCECDSGLTNPQFSFGKGRGFRFGRDTRGSGMPSHIIKNLRRVGGLLVADRLNRALRCCWG